VSPEQGQRPERPTGGCAPTGGHGVAVAARAWYLGCLILAAGRGPCPAPAVTTGGAARMAGAPVVAACSRLPRSLLPPSAALLAGSP
jgi:hypothetical protein